MGIAGDANVGGMGRDVFLEFLHEKSMDDFGRIVGHAFVEVFVEGEQVAASASGGEFGREHGFSARRGFGRLEHVPRRTTRNPG